MRGLLLILAVAITVGTPVPGPPPAPPTKPTVEELEAKARALKDQIRTKHHETSVPNTVPAKDAPQQGVPEGAHVAGDVNFPYDVEDIDEIVPHESWPNASHLEVSRTKLLGAIDANSDGQISHGGASAGLDPSRVYPPAARLGLPLAPCC